jgi:hypothetical protein
LKDKNFFIYVVVCAEGANPSKIYEFGDVVSKIPYVYMDSKWTSLADVSWSPE